MSVFCVTLFDYNIFISFRIFTFSTNEKLTLYLEMQFSLIAIIFGWALYFTIALMTGYLIFSVTDIFRCSVNLIKLRNVKIGYDIRKEFIQNFITPYNFITLDHCYFFSRDNGNMGKTKM